MAGYEGEYGHPYPRVDQYGNPVPPVDEYGNPIPREPAYGSAADHTAGGPAPAEYGSDPVSYSGTGGAAHQHEGVVGAAAYPLEGVGGGVGGLAPGETTAFAYEGMVGGGDTGATAGTGVSAQLQPTRDREEAEHATLGETLQRSGSSSSSSEEDGQGGRRKKKSIKEKIKEKLPGGHKHEEHKAGAGTGTTHAAGAHEKKGIMGKIKEKLPGHH